MPPPLAGAWIETSAGGAPTPIASLGFDLLNIGPLRTYGLYLRALYRRGEPAVRHHATRTGSADDDLRTATAQLVRHWAGLPCCETSLRSIPAAAKVRFSVTCSPCIADPGVKRKRDVRPQGVVDCSAFGLMAELPISLAIRKDRLKRAITVVTDHAGRFCDALSDDFGHRSREQSSTRAAAMGIEVMRLFVGDALALSHGGYLHLLR